MNLALSNNCANSLLVVPGNTVLIKTTIVSSVAYLFISFKHDLTLSMPKSLFGKWVIGVSPP